RARSGSCAWTTATIPRWWSPSSSPPRCARPSARSPAPWKSQPCPSSWRRTPPTRPHSRPASRSSTATSASAARAPSRPGGSLEPAAEGRDVAPRVPHVVVPGAVHDLELLGVQLALQLGGGTEDQAARGEPAAGGDQRAGGDQALGADVRVVEDDRP